MPYTMEDFQKDYVRNHLNVLSPDDVLKSFSPDDVLKRYSPDDRLKGLSPKERLRGLSLEEIKEYLEQSQNFGKEQK